MNEEIHQHDNISTDIAVIGMACRFPGVRNCDEFWEVLKKGEETITHFTPEQLKPYEYEFDRLVNDPHYVKSKGILKDIDKFDAEFFGINPHEASLLDPQQRLWFETAWKALEQAGYAHPNHHYDVGVFAGSYINTYQLYCLFQTRDDIENYVRFRGPGAYQNLINGNASFLPTRTSYLLDLKGPSVNIQTACSTSLVAIAAASQSLLNFESDICIAGGACIAVPQETGYIFQHGAIPSRDGHCRPFDSGANGTVFSNGVGAVILKRLEDALEDNDTILACVKGCAVNNDGASKATYTAPSVEGQARVIAAAQEIAQVHPETISYIEAHGTATNLGDPIEIAGLTKAFRAKTDKKQFCAIGSVKSNLGHMDAAAGVAGFIKTVLSLHNKKIPPTLHYREANPEIDFENSPFFVADKLQEWRETDTPLRAAVSSFGIGGTNAHVILEQAPVVKSDTLSRPCQLMVFSSKNRDSLSRLIGDTAAFFESKPPVSVADAAYTLQKKRKLFDERTFFVCENDRTQLVDMMRDPDPRFSGESSKGHRFEKTVFMFPGQGAHYRAMGKALYDHEPVFRDVVDKCAVLAHQYLGRDLKEIIFDNQELIDTDNACAQLALFAVDYAVAALAMLWGIKPYALVGHSLGEWVAACVAGVLSLEDALYCIYHRGRLMQTIASAGGAVSVKLSSKDAEKYLVDDHLSLAVLNSPATCVISGPQKALQACYTALRDDAVAAIKLPISLAVHSEMIDPIIPPFHELIKDVPFSTPKIPILSTVTGDWMGEETARDPHYWASHMRKTVNFCGATQTLLKEPGLVFLETGPRNSLSTFVLQHKPDMLSHKVIATMGKTADEQQEWKTLLTAVGKLWAFGVPVDWDAFYRHEKRKTAHLPTYCFTAKSYWINPPTSDSDVKKTGENQTPVQSTETGDAQRACEGSIGDDVVAVIQERIGRLSGLDIKSYCTNMTFTEMGFDSLFLAQMANALEKDFAVEVNFRQLTGNLSTIKRLAQYVEQQAARQKSPKTEHPEKQTDVSADIPPGGALLSQAQKRLWFISRLDPDTPAYNLLHTAKIEGVIDRETLDKAIAVIAERHEPLRMRFRETDGVPYALIHSTITADVQIIDIQKENPRDALEHAARMLRDATRRPMNLETGPLWCVRYMRISQTTALLGIITHHSISDGWSSLNFLREFVAACEAIKKDEQPVLPQIEITYSQFASRQQTTYSRIDFSEHETFWKKALPTPLPTLKLMPSRSRPEKPDARGGMVSLSFGAGTQKALSEVAHKHSVTPFAVILSVFSLFLHRYSGQNTIVSGCPTAGRNKAELEPLIGLFINMLPVAVECDPGMKFSEMIRQTAARIEQSMTFADYPFSALVDLLKPARSINHHPIFQVMCAYQNFSQAGLRGPTISCEPTYMNRGISEYDLALYMFNDETGLHGVLEYNAALFYADVIRDMGDHLVHLMRESLSNTALPINSIPMLLPHDKDRLIRACHSTKRELDTDMGLLECIEMQIKKRPRKKACTAGDASLTYQQLGRRADNIASALVRAGVTSGSLIGICVERGVDMVAALLGILKAGAAYVPLDPAFPRSRLEYIADDAALSLIIVDAATHDVLQKRDTRELLAVESLITDQKQSLPTRSPASDDCAYILYTSGSTGKPKGVQISHGALLNFLQSMRREPGITSDDILLAVTTLSFDIAGLEIWLPLITGATVRIAAAHTAIDGFALREEILKGTVTIMQATPSTWKILLESGWCKAGGFKALCGGEAFDRDLADRILATGARLWNMYGPTETTIWSSVGEITQESGPMRLGAPIDNTWFVVVDANRKPLPPGVPGELCIGGAGLAKGYHNLPQLTAEKFVPAPDKLMPGQTMYRTGDLVCLHHDGSYEFLGRIDHQVKIRGFRIELQEIESALRKHELIADAVVWTPTDQVGEKRLVGYVKVNGGGDMKTAELKHFLRDRLPAYMIPEFFRVVDSFPLTPNGKIDRKALTVPATVPVVETGTQTAPRNQIETRMIEIWKSVLGLNDVSIDDDYFEIGGNSMLATRLFAEIEKEFSVKLPLALLFEASTVAGLAARIEANALSRWNPLVPIRTGGTRPPLFLIHGAGGNVLLYKDLARYLGDDQPVYGIQARGLSGDEKPIETIERMADEYSSIILKQYASGPCLLAGYCMGGSLAFETARRLTAYGRQVAFVGLLDTAAFWVDPSFREKIHFFMQNFVFHLHNIAKADMRGKYLFIRDRGIEALRRIRHKSFISRKPTPLQIVTKTNDHAAQIFSPQPYEGKITVFAPFTNFDNLNKPALGWENVQTAGVDVIRLSAYPKGILVEPFVGELAVQMRRAIDAALSVHGAETHIDGGEAKIGTLANIKNQVRPS